MSCRFLWNKSCVARLVTWGRWLKTGVIILVGVLAPIDVKDQTAAHVAFVREENLPTRRQFPPCTTSPHACVCATFPLWPLYSLTPWRPQVHAQRHFYFFIFSHPFNFSFFLPQFKKKNTTHAHTIFAQRIHCSTDDFIARYTAANATVARKARWGVKGGCCGLCLNKLDSTNPLSPRHHHTAVVL